MDTPEKLRAIASKFRLEGTIDNIKPLGEGFINDTYLIKNAEEGKPDYILQRKNADIFPDIPGMMDNIERVTAHIRAKVEAAGGNPEREVMRVLRTCDDKPFLRDDEGDYWAVSVFIPDTVAYQRADTPELARLGGRGIGRFQAQLADFHEPLADTIPGFHNIRFRFQQWDEALKRDRAGRVSSVTEEISWIENRRQAMLDFWKQVEDGTIPLAVTHNDTKINNILFEPKGDGFCVIDLDTVMRAPAFNDFGDAIRSYTNTGLEDDPEVANVGMSLPMFRGYAEGYLSERASTLSKAEKDALAFSALYITYEQVLRFLMDYIDGDTYYKVRYPEHNLVRTRAQYALLRCMEQQLPQMQQIIACL